MLVNLRTTDRLTVASRPVAIEPGCNSRPALNRAGPEIAAMENGGDNDHQPAAEIAEFLTRMDDFTPTVLPFHISSLSSECLSVPDPR